LFGVESGGGSVVLVDESAEPVSTFDSAGFRSGWRVEWLQSEPAMGQFLVVVLEVVDEDASEVALVVVREDLVEGAGELRIAITDQDADVVEDAADREVACLLGDPGAGRVRRDSCQVRAADAVFDEEQDVGRARGASDKASRAPRSDRHDGRPATAVRARQAVPGQTTKGELGEAKRHAPHPADDQRTVLQSQIRILKPFRATRPQGRESRS
jgi:hypothetical protein